MYEKIKKYLKNAELHANFKSLKKVLKNARAQCHL
jgi:hypothetical protein